MAFTVAMVTGLSFAVRPMIRYFTALSTIIASLLFSQKTYSNEIRNNHPAHLIVLKTCSAVSVRRDLSVWQRRAAGSIAVLLRLENMGCRDRGAW
ncbi:hypothetical protein F2P81_008090 [Scophthalmus maximus]|uniref:Uncharacterized protein n=1 Tax=Scophthalmus maximus TaxID=52904 RepID=A0A6A4T400_SCOMX|nr:hypothetical protein F2P81_008090 [Scophthalmus maximus]